MIYIAAMAILNRIRGGGFGAVMLPGRALFWCAPCVALIGYIMSGPWGLMWGAWYLLWAIPAWGYLQLLGRYVPGKYPTELECWLLDITRGNVHLAFLLRHLPAGPLAPLIVVAYEACWRLHPANPIWIAELITGALWGVLIVAVAVLLA